MNANKVVINADKTHLMVMAKKGNRARDQVSMVAGGWGVYHQTHRYRKITWGNTAPIVGLDASYTET